MGKYWGLGFRVSGFRVGSPLAKKGMRALGHWSIGI